MVRIYPFNALISASSGCQQSNTDSSAVPHSFKLRKPHDRSAAIDQHNEKIDIKLGVRTQHEVGTDLHRQTPVVVISRMSNTATEDSFSSSCNEHGINYQNVDEFVDGGILEIVKEQSFLIYSQDTGGNHRQVGICAALAVEDCLKGFIKRHENIVMEIPPIRKAHHTSHPCNVDPVMIMYKQSEMIQSIIDRITTHHCPVILQSRSTANIQDGGRHKIWSIIDQADIESIKTAFLHVDSLYIADGHHRTAAACRIALRNKNNVEQRKSSHTKYLLGFLYPHTHVRVIPYNKCITDLGGRSPSEFLRLVSGVFHIENHNTGNSFRGNRNSNSTSGSSKYERKSQGVGTVDYLSDGESILSTEASLSLWPVWGGHVSTCESLGKNRDSFDCLNITPCSSTDSDSQDSFDQYDLERSRRHVDIESLTYHNSRCERDCLDSLTLQGVKRNIPTDAFAPVEKESTALERVYREGTVSESKCSGGDLHEHLIMMYLEGRWLELRPLDAVEEDDSDPLSSLDIQILFERLLRPLLGIECPRSDKRIIYVCGNEGVEGLESRVDSQKASVAFRVGTVTVSDIMRVADAGQLMPPKATCFTPKPLCGLMVRLH